MSEKSKAGNERAPVTVKLEYPIEWAGETINEIVLHRPKAADIEHINQDCDMGALLKIASKCSKVEYPIIKELDASDAIKICDVIDGFLGSGRGTGKHS